MADKTVNELPLLSNGNFTPNDYFMVWDESTDRSCKFSVQQYREEVLEYGLTGGNYNGTLDASASSSINLPGAVNGDWFFVDVAGIIEGLEADVHDVIKYNGSVWELVPRGSVVAASSRQTLLSTNVAIAADGEQASADPLGVTPGWYYKNSTNGKINWYFYGDSNYTNNTFGKMNGMYAIVNITSGYLYFNLYTKPEADANNASWYRSRVTWDNAVDIAPGRYLIHTDGMDVTAVDKTNLTVLPLSYFAGLSAGPQNDAENVWLMSLSTSSNFPEGHNEFIVEQFAYRFDTQTHVMDLVGVQADAEETDPLFNASFKGNYANEASLPSASAGQWAINDSTDTIWIYDGDDDDWVEAGGTALPPQPDIPYIYSYGNDNGTQTGYGWMNADMDDWNGLPNGALVADSNSFRPVDAAVKFATLKSVGDKVAIQDVNITNFGTYYYRHAFLYVEGGVSPVFSLATYNDVGSGTGYYVEGDDSYVFGHNCWVNPYYGATSYAGGMNGPNGSNYSPADKSSVTLEWEIIDQGGGDTRLQMSVDGHVLSISQSPLVDGFATNGLDLYVLAKHAQVWPQPSGGAVNDPNPPAGDPWPGPHVQGADFDGVNNRIKIPASAIASKDWHPDDDSAFTVTAQTTFDPSITPRMSLYTTREANFDWGSASYYGYMQGFSASEKWNIPQAIWYDSYDKGYAGNRHVVSLSWSGKRSSLVNHCVYASGTSQKWLRTDYKGFYNPDTRIFTLDDAGEYLWQYATYPGNSWSLGMNTAGQWTRFLSNENALKTGGINNYNQTIINSPGQILPNGQLLPTELIPVSGWSFHVDGDLVAGISSGTGSDNPINYLGSGPAYVGMRSYDDSFTSVHYGKSTDMNEWTLMSVLEPAQISTLHAHIADGVDVRDWLAVQDGVTMQLYYPMGGDITSGPITDFSDTGADAEAEGMI